MNLARTITMNMLGLLSGRLFVSVARLIVMLGVARYLGEEVMGLFVLFISLIYLCEWLVDFGTVDIAVRAITQSSNSPSNSQPPQNAILLKAIQGGIAIGLLLLLMMLLSLEAYLWAALWAGIGILAYALALNYRVVARVNYQMHRDMWLEASGVLVMLALMAIVIANHGGVVELIACHALSRVIYLGLSVYVAQRASQPSFQDAAQGAPQELAVAKRQSSIKLIQQALPLGLAGLLVVIYDAIAPMLLSSMLSMEAVAHYGVVLRFLLPVVVITQAIANVFFTQLSSLWSHTDNSKFAKAQQSLVELVLFVSGGAFCVVVGGSTFWIGLFGDEYLSSAYLLEWTALAILARSLSVALSGPIIICGAQQKTLVLTLFVVLFSGLLMALLIPRWGLEGAILSYLLVEVVFTAIPLFFVSQYLAKYRLQVWPVIALMGSALSSAALVKIVTYFSEYSGYSGYSELSVGSFASGIVGLFLFVVFAFLSRGISLHKIMLWIDTVMDKRNRNEERQPIKNHQGIKVAIACPGVGLEQRGFERMCQDIFHLMKDDLDITLYKGGGETTAREKRLRFLPRNGQFLKRIPLYRLIFRTPIHIECLTFAFALLWAIRRENIDVIHVTDPPLAKLLYHIRRWINPFCQGLLFNRPFKILYAEATAMPPSNYPPSDHLQQISKVTFEEAVQYGIPRRSMTLVPLGIFPEKFQVDQQKAKKDKLKANLKQTLRAKYGIGKAQFVVLSLAALNRQHKRIDYLIDEVANVETNQELLLWMDGSMDQGDPGLIQYARDRLGDRCRITQVPTEQVGELFIMADLMVHTAHFEAFGLAIVEGASQGLPILTHSAPHFRWMLQNEHCLIDMLQKNSLSKRLNELLTDPEQLNDLRISEEAVERFYWVNLKSQYADLYQSVKGMDDAVAPVNRSVFKANRFSKSESI